MMAWPVAVVLAVVVTLLVAGALIDVRTRRLPNWLSVLTLVASVALVAVRSHSFTIIAGATVHALLSLLVGMVLFRLRLVGGGDAKFYAGIAAGFPLASAARLAFATAIVGLAAAVSWLVCRRAAGLRVRASDDDVFTKFPLGVALSGGALFLHMGLF